MKKNVEKWLESNYMKRIKKVNICTKRAFKKSKVNKSVRGHKRLTNVQIYKKKAHIDLNKLET